MDTELPAANHSTSFPPEGGVWQRWLSERLLDFGRQLGVSYVTGSIFTCSLLAIAMILSNILPPLAVWRTRSLQRPSSLLLAFMAVSDALCSLPLIQTTFYVKYFRHTHFQCQFAIFCVFPVTLSALCICSVSIERLLALAAPYWHQKHVTNRCVSLLFAALTIFAILSSVAQGIYLQDNHSGTCVMQERIKPELYIPLFLVITFSLPLVLLFIINIILILYVRKHNKRHQNTHGISPSSRPCMYISLEGKAARVSMTVVGVFYFCFTPYLVFTSFMYTVKQNDDNIIIYNKVYFATMVLCFANNAANPWVYCIRLHRFRRAYYDIFLSCWRRSRTIGESSSRYIPPDPQAVSCVRRNSQMNNQQTVRRLSASASALQLDIPGTELQTIATTQLNTTAPSATTLRPSVATIPVQPTSTLQVPALSEARRMSTTSLSASDNISATYRLKRNASISERNSFRTES